MSHAASLESLSMSDLPTVEAFVKYPTAVGLRQALRGGLVRVRDPLALGWVAVPVGRGRTACRVVVSVNRGTVVAVKLSPTGVPLTLAADPSSPAH